MTQVSDKQEFKEKFDYLHEVKGISITKISKATNIKYGKLADIRKGKSSGNSADLQALNDAYADILEVGGQPDSEKERLAQLEEEFERMKKENMEIKNMLLKLQNELLTKKK